ncbi:zinc transporter ZupT [compost metagenome]
MEDYLKALLIALLPAVGILAGALLAERFNVTQRTLSLALHMAAGIMLGAVGVELMPEALKGNPPWVPIVAFLLGGGFAILLDRVTSFVSTRMGAKVEGGPWALFIGVCAEVFSDGLMVGTGTSVEFGLGLLLGLAQAPGNIPEGFATMASFREMKVPRMQRILLVTAFVVPIVVGVTLGYWGVRGQPPIVQLSLLAFIAGLLLTIAIEEIVPQAHEKGRDSRTATGLLLGGFALFALLAVYFD